MNKFRKCVFCLLALMLLLVSGCDSKTTTTSSLTEDTPPVLMDNTVLKGRYEMEELDLVAGTAFAVTLPEADTDLILTCFHIFGPMGGLPEIITADALPSRIVKASFKDAFTDIPLGETTKTLQISDAIPMDEITKDLAAFYYSDNMTATKLSIAKTPAKTGDHVWLAAFIKGEEGQQQLYHAIVDRSDDDGLTFIYEESQIPSTISGTSGAPILNQAGEVVSINLGAGEGPKGIYGFANPSSHFKEMLLRALENAPSQ